ncbi:MAG: hypothetical protein ABSH13_01130 [Candidatus Acidiferrum sp.]
MRLKTTVFALAVVLGPVAAQQAAAAQDDHLVSSSLNVTTQFSYDLAVDCQSGEGLVVQLRYTGAQALRGYLVRLALADSSTGKSLGELSLQEIRDSRQPMIPAGAEWARNVCTIPKKIAGSPTSVTATVDVLKFADGSIWGPAARRESHQLIGTLDGMDFIGKTTELERFVSPILPQQGPLPVENVESQTIGPLKIKSGVWLDERGKEMLAADVTNESSVPIRGYLFTTSFFDPTTGTRIRRASTKQLETHGNPSDYLAPGATWVADPRKFSYLPDGTLASYKITVDLVVFADGSTFGPKRSQESDEVLGMFDGIDTAKRISQEVSANR